MNRPESLIVRRCPDNLAGRFFRRPAGTVRLAEAVAMALVFRAEEME